MPNSYELTKLDPEAFENLVTSITMRALGSGATGFGPGPDGGRDSYFEGEAPYPSESDRWKGVWYVQSKFLRPHLSKNAQEWLIDQVKLEIKAFESDKTSRKLPDIWIIATNVDPSAVARTGAWDKIKRLVRDAFPKLKFDLWGGQKILRYLEQYPSIADAYAHFLAPGILVQEMRTYLSDSRANIDQILNDLIVTQFTEQIHTKLDQAGSAEDSRPGIHQLFIDLPYECPELALGGDITRDLIQTSARTHRPSHNQALGDQWQKLESSPNWARIIILKGGPGQGKSTIGQYLAQVHRAALIELGSLRVPLRYRTTIDEVRNAAETRGHYPAVPRIPVLIELKDFAQWFGRRGIDEANGVLSYLSSRIHKGVGVEVFLGTLRRAISVGGWFFIFDGLDEVPNDVKDPIAREIRHFLDNTVTELDADVLSICTSRPQGYSGQFDMLEGPVCTLTRLMPNRALECCKHIVSFGRSPDDAVRLMQILNSAIDSPTVRELMTTPLQSHIMAVVVRNGGRPPERRWLLFMNYYNIMKKREVLKNFADPRVARMLSEQDKLLKSIHSLMGFSLHVRAERAEGAQTQLTRDEFEALVRFTVDQLIESDAEATVAVLMEATTQRLVFVNTPDSAKYVRFDIRQLQEFFAAEFLYEGVDGDTLNERLRVVAGDSHWLEVMHFVLSSLVENSRTTELAIAVQELQRINEFGDTPSEQMMSRRTARGAHLTLRLVQEGVLDQDKQLRNQFKLSLLPILGVLEGSAISPLSQLRDSDTKRWFVNFCLESLTTLSEQENINSILYLSFLLKDDDSRVKQVCDYFRDASTPYRCYVVTSLCTRYSSLRQRKHTVIHTWVIDLIIAMYLSPELGDLDARTIRSMRIILAAEEFESRIDNNPETSDEIKQVIKYSLNQDQEFSKENTIKIGMIEGILSDNDWINGQFPEDVSDGILQTSLAEQNNIIGLIVSILHFAKERSQPSLGRAADKIMTCGLKVYYTLPSHIRALLPSQNGARFEHIYWQDLLALSPKKFSQIVRLSPKRSVKRNRPISAWIISDEFENLDAWKELIQVSIRYALLLFARPHQTPRVEEIANLFVDALIQAPEVALNNIEMVGCLQDATPGKFAELKRAMVAAAGNCDSYIYGTSQRIYPFPVDMSTESVLLPYIVQNLQSTSSAGRAIEIQPEMLRQFVPDYRGLLEFTQSENENTTKYAAALVILFAHLIGSNELSIQAYTEELCRQIVRAYRPEIAEWYVFGICASLVGSSTQHQVCSRKLLGELLIRANDNYTGRAYLHAIVAEARERSTAPVHNSSLKERQLAIAAKT